MQRFNEKEWQKLQALEKQTLVLDPKNILKRGYSITRIDGKVVSSENQLIHDQIIETEFYDFSVESRIKK